MIRVVLIDDHALVRTGLRMILQQHADMDVVGEAEDGEQGFWLIRRSEPDVALVDIHMPGFSGVELMHRVRSANLATRIVILTIANESPFPRRLLNAGASAYLTKGCPSDELIKAVRRVADGQRYIGADIAQQLALDNKRDAESPFTELSTRELEVAMMLSQGLNAQIIAGRLNLSAKTIATYKYRVFEKLGIDNVIALAHLVTLHGLADSSSAAASRTT
jgi:DNA-binding NarL/FixJ family response regulator